MRQSTKYSKVIHHIYDLVEGKVLSAGESLPSISEVSRTLSVARETVVKAYKKLKQEGLIDSVPGKGFFLLTERISGSSRVLLVLNSFNPYMQVLYNAFSETLPEGTVGDVFFHHNNYEIFRNLLESYSSRYTHYIIKPFHNEKVPALLESLDAKRTLILDRSEYIPRGVSYLCQDFSGGFEESLGQITEKIEQYSSLNMIRSRENPHPEESFKSFKTFLKEHHYQGAVLPEFRSDLIQRGGAYLLVTERDLVSLLSLISSKGWVPGKDIGILSYNDFPLLKFVGGGISSLSVDFNQMGVRAAGFPATPVGIQEILKPRLIMRSSF